jgi:phosphatidylglycerol---prolipoprotein diacylglyceryl transferase
MHPILFEIGRWPVYSYGVLLAAAYLAGLQLAVVRARRAGLDAAKIMDLGIYLIIAALVGAKVMLIFVDFDYFRSNPAELFSLVRAGGVFYGGLILSFATGLWLVRRILSFATGLWLVRRYRLPVWASADMYAPGIALGHVVGRMGCLLAGCCYGRPTDLPWGLTFTDPVAASNVGTPLGVPLHPTQIYDAGAELLILVILLVFERRGRPFNGRTFWLYILLYAISRFIVEIFRGDPRGMVFGISTSQFVSLLILPVAIVMLLRLRGARAAR